MLIRLDSDVIFEGKNLAKGRILDVGVDITESQGKALLSMGKEAADVTSEEENRKVTQTTAEAFETMTNKELDKLLEERNVDIPKKYNKADLIALLARSAAEKNERQEG
jgi:hypothetical protein